MPRLMDFYKCYRAYVRGKVESLHSVAHAAPAGERQSSATRARHYFRLALSYAVAGSGPVVLAVTGRIASGKSTLARALGAELGWEVLSSDQLRKDLAGEPLLQRGNAAVRARLYSASMTRKTYRGLLQAARGRWRAGKSVILDATFARREHREWLATSCAQHGAPWRLLEVRVNDGVVKRRLRARAGRRGEISDARLEDFTQLTGLYEAPTEIAGAQRVTVDSTGPLIRTVTRALQSLARLQADAEIPARA
jgi:predicted kinase